MCIALKKYSKRNKKLAKKHKACYSLLKIPITKDGEKANE